MTLEICTALPEWNQVIDRFGDRPYVPGRGTCQRYRDQLAQTGSLPRPRIAGLPNTPAETMARLLWRNGLLSGTDLAGDNATVPWGAHTPWSAAKTSAHFDASVFPIVIVWNPILFMGELCSHPNDLRWSTGKQGRCPNLIPSGVERKCRLASTFRVQYPMQLHDDGETTVLNYKSIADFWVSWIDEWSRPESPRLIIRSEDLFPFPEQVLEIVSECLGGKDGYQPESPETYPLLDDLKQYTNVGRDVLSLTKSEMVYLVAALKPSILLALHYEINDLKSSSSITPNRYSRGKLKTSPPSPRLKAIALSKLALTSPCSWPKIPGATTRYT